MRFKSDPEALSLEYEEQFREYGIYVDAGTGRETFRNNPGDIGRPVKVRKAKPWFSRKYYMSVMNLRDFYAEQLGLETVDMIAAGINAKELRRNVVTVREGGSERFVMNNTSIPGANLPN